MESKPVRIREAAREDVPAMLEIYAPYVRDTAISFEYAVPTQEEFSARIARIQSTYPCLVAESEGRILGYAYCVAFIGRAAYQWSVETTIYVDRACRGRGAGSALYRALEACLRAMNIQNMNACIGWTDAPDEHLNNDSTAFHEHMGFTLVGRFHHSGCKFGRWYDMIWMEKLIGDHSTPVQPVRPFPEVRQSVDLTEFSKE